MTDMSTKEERSEIMHDVKGKGTKLKLDTTSMLFCAKIYYHLRLRALNTPDFIV